MVDDVKAIVIDTSAILACIEDGCDPFESLREIFEGLVEVIIPSAVLDELRELAKGKGRRGRCARLGLEILLSATPSDLSIRFVDLKGRSVDEALLQLASELNAFLLTADAGLRKKAEARGLRTLTYLKSKRRFG